MSIKKTLTLALALTAGVALAHHHGGFHHGGWHGGYHHGWHGGYHHGWHGGHYHHCRPYWGYAAGAAIGAAAVIGSSYYAAPVYT